MKFIKGKLSLLYPLFLLLFYFYVRPQFRPLAQYVSNSVASANSYYWTLFGLEGLYATSKVGNSMQRFGFQPSSTVAYIFSTIPFR